MSIRLRLTLWYSTVLAVMLLVLGGAICALLARNVYTAIDTQLASTADQILSASRVRTFSNLLQVVLPEEIDLFRTADVGVMVLDNTYAVVQKSQNIGPFSKAFDVEALSQIQSNESIVRDIVVSDIRARVLTVPIAVGDYETPATALVLTSVSSNPYLLPNTNLVLSGSALRKKTRN